MTECSHELDTVHDVDSGIDRARMVRAVLRMLEEPSHVFAPSEALQR